MSVANSPLVKTAIAGEDANWGRVVMAVGKAGEPADRDRLSISFNGILVATRGARDPPYDETDVPEARTRPEIQNQVAPGLREGPGPGALVAALAWHCGANQPSAATPSSGRSGPFTPPSARAD